MRFVWTAMVMMMVAFAPVAHASIAYGSINNFDTVNDTGEECHGFEIEIEDIHDTDITYTYDWNHYGTPIITEDNSDPQHPKVRVRYESKKNTDGSWSAFTAVPSGPINPTDGHQFTNPNVNFGGEHFGVGFYGAPTAISYFWLVDDGAGNLIRGGAVNISTPSFSYFPPAGGFAGQVQAAIVHPPEPQVMEFGEAVWVKATKTTTHNNNKVELRDLVSDDPDDPGDRNWKNGEPDEVEVEWQILQTEFAEVNGGANGEMENEAEELPDGDEIITRRYDFYKYVGPLDNETGEAKAEKVGPDGIHGKGTKVINGVEVDLSTVVVVGDYIGAQMAGFDAEGQIGLIDHLQDGEEDAEYVDRRVVVQGTPPIVTTHTGSLPDGMTFDDVTGILSGTPTESGSFDFSVHSTDANGGDVSKDYILTIAPAGEVLAPHSAVATSPFPANAGTTSGDGDYENGAQVKVIATPAHGYRFVNWTESGSEVSTDASYQFTIDVNHSLVANFALKGSTKVKKVVVESPVAAGTKAKGKVVLKTPAPDGGSVVTLESSDPTVLSVPAQVTVAAGETLAKFKATAGNVAQASNADVTASLSGSTKSTTVNVTP